ncbi:hypothetical protein HNP33_003702 [Comamonas odontotermitis]|uniref:Arc-like DNA binding domain-containing protein n=1 Tax=Comamonas odontotermitis TaxID=379895 RepID=A0ABR6RK93_9BURK|nr:Arc family DNA-binding protein [Comamonas odontotermitis]MBB6579588.1 hypothetical protein [Comamonas odontotermitis]
MDSLKDHQKESTIHAMTDRHQQKPYPLRMPDDLRAKLEDAAKEGSRSLHAEILARLDDSFSGGGDADKVALVLSHKLSRAEVEVGFEKIKNLTTTYEAFIASQAAIELMEVVARKIPSAKFDEKMAQDIRAINEKHSTTIKESGPQPIDLLEKKSRDALATHIENSDKLMARMLNDHPLNEANRKTLLQHFKDGDGADNYERVVKKLTKIVSDDESAEQAPKRPKK